MNYKYCHNYKYTNNNSECYYVSTIICNIFCGIIIRRLSLWNRPMVPNLLPYAPHSCFFYKTIPPSLVLLYKPHARFFRFRQYVTLLLLHYSNSQTISLKSHRLIFFIYVWNLEPLSKPPLLSHYANQMRQVGWTGWKSLLQTALMSPFSVPFVDLPLRWVFARWGTGVPHWARSQFSLMAGDMATKGPQ